MLGLSISKLLFTVGIIVAVWRGFKMFEKFKARAAEEEPPAPPRQARASDEVEMIECPRCGAFTPKGQFCTCNG